MFTYFETMTFSRNPKSKYFINDTEYTGYAKTLPGKEFAISGIQYKWVSTGVKASVTEPIPDNPPPAVFNNTLYGERIAMEN